MFSSKLFVRGLSARRLVAAACAACALFGFGVSSAQTVTGTMAPASATASQSVVLTLGYSGFNVQNIGYKFRVYFDSTALTFVSSSNGAAPASAYQGDSGVLLDAANGDGVAATNSYVDLIWADFATSAWPTSPSGNLGTVSFTTAAGFTGTSVSLRESAVGAQVRNVPGSTVALPLFVPATAATFTALPTTLSFAEGGVAQNVTVACSGTIGSPSPVVINIASSNTASFTVGAPTLSFTTCPSSQTVAVTPRPADAGFNPTQTGNVTFSTATAGATAPASVGVTVTDNQSPAVYSVTKTTATVTEGNVATDTLTVSCTGAFTGGLTSGSVQYAITGLTNPGDIAAPALTGAINFTACGGATQSVTISPRTNDAIVQGNKSGSFTISTPVAGTLGAVTTGTINVNDDDTPQTVTVAVSGSPASEAGGLLTYTFTRVGGNAAAVAATLAINVTPPATSSRYSTTCAATITFAANAPTASCTVTGIDNAVVDGNVNAVVTVAAPTVSGAYTVGTPASATGVVADNDISVTVTTASVTEGGTVSFSIACTGPTGATVTGLSFGVTPAQDAGAAAATPGMSGAVGTLTCGTAFVVSVPTFNDTIIGNNRSLTLALSGTAVGNNGSSVVLPAAGSVASVIDNDVPLVVPTMGVIGLGLMSLMLAGLVGFQRRRVNR